MDMVLMTGPRPIEAATADALVALVRAVARAEILPRFRDLGADDVATKSGPQDLVTVADQLAEAALSEGVRHILPNAAVIGEEAVAADPSTLAPLDAAETCVVLDPIDGTWNFAHGLGVFGVILAVLRWGEPVYGLLYDPLADDWVSARVGGGAWHHRPGREPRRLATGPPLPLAEARGCVPLHDFDAADRPGVAAGLPRLGPSSTLGCSCHEYRQMAMGALRFAVSPAPAPWDHAAGALVVREAGGCALSAGGRPYRPASDRATLVVADATATARALIAALDL